MVNKKWSPESCSMKISCGPLFWQGNTGVRIIREKLQTCTVSLIKTHMYIWNRTFVYSKANFNEQTWLFDEVNVVDIRWLDTSCWGCTGCICLSVDKFNFALSLVFTWVVEANGGDAHHKENSSEKKENDPNYPNKLGNSWGWSKNLWWILQLLIIFSIVNSCLPWARFQLEIRSPKGTWRTCPEWETSAESLWRYHSKHSWPQYSFFGSSIGVFGPPVTITSQCDGPHLRGKQEWEVKGKEEKGALKFRWKSGTSSHSRSWQFFSLGIGFWSVSWVREEFAVEGDVGVSEAMEWWSKGSSNRQCDAYRMSWWPWWSCG